MQAAQSGYTSIVYKVLQKQKSHGILVNLDKN